MIMMTVRVSSLIFLYCRWYESMSTLSSVLTFVLLVRVVFLRLIVCLRNSVNRTSIALVLLMRSLNHSQLKAFPFVLKIKLVYRLDDVDD